MKSDKIACERDLEDCLGQVRVRDVCSRGPVEIRVVEEQRKIPTCVPSIYGLRGGLKGGAGLRADFTYQIPKDVFVGGAIVKTLTFSRRAISVRRQKIDQALIPLTLPGPLFGKGEIPQKDF